jgi:hybrid polyketide synthase/nonribosomal peptide synthetase ACE1
VKTVNFREYDLTINIGAGTGGVTKTIIKNLGDAFRSYTYTDISSGFFETAQEVFREYRDRMIFRTLDAEKDPSIQGFSEGTFDLIVCSLVLHATENLEATLANVRRLLKPGGYLALLEITDMDSFRTGFAMSALPGWWLGHHDGRALNPCVSAGRWEIELRKTGFSGIKAKTDDLDPLVWPFSVIVAQATDDQIQLLQSPLSLPPKIQEKDLTIVGGASAATATYVQELESLLRPWFRNVSRIETAAHFNSDSQTGAGTVLSITELDIPIFEDLTESVWHGLRNIFDHSRNVLWITRGAHGTEPYAVMMTGFARTLAREMPHLRMQCLDLDAATPIVPASIAQALLSLDMSEAWEQDLDSKALWSVEPEAALQ